MNARTICWVLSIALFLAMGQPAGAQDAAGDQAKALLTKGLEQYDAQEYVTAKATLLQVDRSALEAAQQKTLDERLAAVDTAIREQAAARDAIASAEQAIKDNNLAKAKDSLTRAAGSAYLTPAERKDASAQLAQVDGKLKAAGAETSTERPVAVAAATEAAPQTNAEEALTMLREKRSVTAQAYVVEAKAAIEQNQPAVAVKKLEQALALVDDPQTRTLLEQARDMQSRQAVEGDSALSRMASERQVRKQMAQAEFDQAIKQSNELLAKANAPAGFDAATNAAMSAKTVLDTNKTLFSEQEYTTRLSQVDNQNRLIQDRRSAWANAEAKQSETEARNEAQRHVEETERQRRDKISNLISRTKVLIEERKYAEALDVVNMILKLDPENGYAASVKEGLIQQDLLNQEGTLYKQYNEQLQKNQVANREAEIPWYDLLHYPEDWREVTARRAPYSANAATETEKDRIVRQKLKTNIPSLNIPSGTFEDVIQFFRTSTNVNFHPNWQALEAAGVQKTAPVNLNLTDVTVEKALALVLGDLSTTSTISFIISDGVVTISTKEDLAKTPTNRVYDIRDLIYAVPDYSAPELTLSSNGENGTNNTSSSNNTNNGNQANRDQMVLQIQDTIRNTVDRDSWAPTGIVGQMNELHGTLVISQTLENHQKVATLLDQLRETRALQVSIEARFISVSTGYMRSIGVDLDMFFNTGSGLGGGLPGGAVTPGGGPGYRIDPFTGARVPEQGTSAWGSGNAKNDNLTPIGAVTGAGSRQIGFGNMVGVSTPMNGSIGTAVTSPGLSVGGTFLDDVQVDFLIQATEATSSTRTLTAPRLTLYNGQSGYVTIQQNQAYVASFEPIVSDNTSALRPIIQQVGTGTRFQVRPTVSADRRYVLMNLEPDVTVLNGFTQGNVGGTIVQLPNVTQQSIRTTVNVPDGGTLLLGGQRLTAEVEREGGVPILSKIPVIQRLYTNRGKVRDEQMLLILVKPRIIIQREQEDLAFPPAN